MRIVLAIAKDIGAEIRADHAHHDLARQLYPLPRGSFVGRPLCAQTMDYPISTPFLTQCWPQWYAQGLFAATALSVFF